MQDRQLEKHLGWLAADEEGCRVELVQVATPGEVPTLEMRMQRDCGELGWQTLKRIRLAGGQWAAMRDAMNLMDIDARQARRDEAAAGATHDDPARRPQLRLIG